MNLIQNHLIPINEAAKSLAVNENLIVKFIHQGLLFPVNDGATQKLTPYGYRRLARIIDLYEKSYSTESIESIINL